MSRRFEISIKFSPSKRKGNVWTIPRFPKEITRFTPSDYYLVFDKEKDILTITLVDEVHARSGGIPRPKGDGEPEHGE